MLHESPGGYANNAAELHGLAQLTQAEDVRIEFPVTVTGFQNNQSGAVTYVSSDRGSIDCEQVVIEADP